MAQKKRTEAEEAKRETQARTDLIRVRLDQLGERREDFCHRDKVAFTDGKLKSFAEQLIREGLQVPVEVVAEPKDAPKPYLLVKGHRRAAALRLCAKMKAPGFAEDMEIPAFLVKDATPSDLLCRSLADNEARLGLSVHEKIRACKKLHDADVPESRAASAMGISTSSYQRSLLIASHTFMFDFVAEKCIDPTPAYELLTVARQEKRLRELEEDLNEWVAKARLEIQARERKKAEAGKELPEAEQQVKRLMKAHMWKAWKRAIKNKKRFSEVADVKWRYGAELDPQSKKLTVPGVNFNLATAKFSDLVEVAAKLDSIATSLRPYILMKRREEELLEGNKAQASAEDYLRKIGLEEAVPLLKEEAADSEEEIPTEEPRLERELSGEIDLPSQEGTTNE